MPVNARKYTRHPTPMSRRRPAASRSALELVFADEGLGAANRTWRAGFLAASVPLERAEIVRPTRAPTTRALRRRGVVSLGKALTDSMTPTTKLAHPFDCLRSGGEHDRQLCRFRRHGKASAGLLARRRRRRASTPLSPASKSRPKGRDEPCAGSDMRLARIEVGRSEERPYPEMVRLPFPTITRSDADHCWTRCALTMSLGF